MQQLYWNIFYLLLISHPLYAIGNDDTIARGPQKRGVMDNINDGLRYAGQMLGINTAADVANLVAKAFSSATTTKSKQKPDLLSMFQKRQTTRDSQESRPDAAHEYNYSQEQEETQQQAETALPAKDEPVGLDFNAGQLLTNMLRMIGFDASKLGALAINAIIMIAQAIGNAVMSNGGNKYATPSATYNGPEAIHERDTNEHQPRALRDGTPIDWFLQNPTRRMKKLLNDMSDTKLPDKINEILEHVEEENGEQAGCLKMLMCKSAPFIWGMQKSLAKRLNINDNSSQHFDADEEDYRLNTKGFFKHLPSINEYREHGAACEERFAGSCDLSSLYPK